jgi:hypothetical protein
MACRDVILVAMLGVGLVITDAADAQLSPRGIIGGITRPFRAMLGRFGHFPRSYHHTAATDRAPGDSAPRDPSSASGLGPAGPPGWPNAFEDVVGFAFSPDEYAQELRSRGFDVIADTITGHIAAQPRAHTATTTGTAVRDDVGNGAPADSCNTSVNRNNWPAARIEQLMQLRDAQHDALDKLQAAVNQSAKSIGGDCRDSGTPAPPDRLKILIQTLWTVQDGGIFVRAPLKNFLDTLTDAQKSTFASRQPQEKRVASAGSANDSGTNKQYQACAAPNVEASERMIKEIEQRVRPHKEQAAGLENFHKASSDMAKLLMASCAQAVPADPLARLDAADDQVTAMNYAATTVQIAFDDFYGKLDNGQKARLESTGR